MIVPPLIITYQKVENNSWTIRKLKYWTTRKFSYVVE